MTLKDEIAQARIKALREKDNLTKTAVGYILSAIKQQEVDTKKEVTDVDVIAILKTLIRQRKDSIEKYPDIKELVERDSAEIDLLSKYMPVQLSEDEVMVIIRDGISEAKSVKPTVASGEVMKLIKGQLHGKTDMSKVKGLVEKELG
jgi:hypothetical protein